MPLPLAIAWRRLHSGMNGDDAAFPDDGVIKWATMKGRHFPGGTLIRSSHGMTSESVGGPISWDR